MAAPPPPDRRPPALPVERVHGAQPETGPPAGSHHSRLLDHLLAPAEDHDPRRAVALCGQLARAGLRDFAPALLLLPPAERRRSQVLAAYTLTLFDFARQRGVEGERLAAINRFEFALELALEGEPPGQPIFVQIAAEERLRPWPRSAVDGIGRAARRRATSPSGGRRAGSGGQLAASLLEALTATPAPPRLAAAGGALLRLRALQDLGEELRQHRDPFLADGEGPSALDPAAPPDPAHLAAAVRDECRRLRPLLLAAAPELPELPRPLRAAALYLLLAGTRLLARVESLEERVMAAAPRLGAPSRLALLARAWWMAASM